MYQQELQIINKKVILINKRSEFELEDRGNIPEEDELFTLGDSPCLNVGSKDKDLNLLVLKPETDKRGTPDDVTFEKKIKHRIYTKDLHARVAKFKW